MGGVISDVFEGVQRETGRDVVIKYTRDRTNDSLPFNKRIDHFIPAAGHDLDTEILRSLRESIPADVVVIPEVLCHLPDVHITVMEHLGKRPHNMSLMSTSLADGITQSGAALGKAIANVQFQLSRLALTPTEDSVEQFEERGSGLLNAYRNKQVPYKQFMDRHLRSKTLIPTDIHPKNIMYNIERFAIIDYGRTAYGDPSFVLPNFASHILMNYTLGKIGPETEVFYFDVIAGYQSECANLGIGAEVDKDFFGFYAASEILARSNGRWVNYLDEDTDVEASLALSHLGREIIKQELSSPSDVFRLSGLVRGRFLDGCYAL